MCRMIGFLSTRPCDVGPYFSELQRQAREGVDSPHKDGWGLAVYERSNCHVVKRLVPAFEDSLTPMLSGNAAVLHARKASFRRTADNVNCLHPFQFTVHDKPWSFCHNGTIHGIPSCLTERATDSKVFAGLIEHNMMTGQEPDASYRSAVEEILRLYRPNSLNSFLVTDLEFLAVAHSYDKEHQIFFRASAELLEVSTEPAMPDKHSADWTLLAQDSMLHATNVDGHIELDMLEL